MGDTTRSGGDGWGPANLTLTGGGGGESAGASSNGTAASSQTGATGVSDGGDGGSGGAFLGGNGSSGSVPGGGGGGASALSVSATTGGAGSGGQVILTYTIVPTKVRVETAADGSGSVVSAQNLTAGSSITVYAITRDASDNFIANVAADAWSLQSKTGGVVDGDLVPAGDSKSAVMTGHLVGTAAIRSTSEALTTIDSGTITVVAGAIIKIAFTTAAQSIAAGAVSTIMTIQTQDANSNASNVTGATVVNLTSNSSGTATFYSDSGGTIPITFVTIANGASSASFYYKDTAVGTPTVTADEFPSADYTAGTQQETITAGSASYLKVTGTSSATAGVNDELTITAYDSSNNVATSYTGSKSLTFSGPGNAQGGTVPTVEGTNIGSATSVTFTSGVSNTNAATLLAYKAETTTVDVTDGSINSFGNASYDLDLTVNPSVISTTNSLLSASPSPASQGGTVTVTVQARDLYQNNLTSGAAVFTYTVTGANPSGPTLLTNNGNGTYSGTYTATNTGSDAITALLSTVAVGHDTDGTDDGTFNLTIGNTTPTKVRVETAANGSGTVVSAQNLASGSTITVYSISRGSADNFIANVTADAWSLQNKTGGIVDGNLVPSGDNKSAVLTGSLTGTTTIRATSGVLTVTESGIITVVASTATQIAVNAGNNQSATVSTSVSTAPSVIVKDVGNNPISGVSVTFAVTTGGGSITGSSQSTDSNGVATVGSWTLGGTAGSNTLTATASGLTGSPVTFTATGNAASGGGGGGGTSYSLPTVTTQLPSEIATGNGNIISTGGLNIEKRGFAYSTSSRTDPGSVAPESSGYVSFVGDTGSFQTGAFAKILSGIISDTTYFVRAYAYNTRGYSYGNEVSFTVKSTTQKVIPLPLSTPPSTQSQMKIPTSPVAVNDKKVVCYTIKPRVSIRIGGQTNPNLKNQTVCREVSTNQNSGGVTPSKKFVKIRLK